MRSKIDHLGQVFSRLTVLEQAETLYRNARWKCRCSCGEIVIVDGGSLRSGATKSCGCLRREVSAGARFTHGQIRTTTYNSWRAMLNRCRLVKNNMYYLYGGRGITVCERWMKFENFISDMGARPEGCFIDRINNDGNYEPSNCRWATAKEQSRNQRTNRMITAMGKTMCVAAFAEEVGVGASTILYRLNRGIPAAKAIEKVEPRNSQKDKRQVFG